MDMTPEPGTPHGDWVALTEYELREVTMHMPGTQTVPVTTRGFDADQVLAIQASGPGGLHALVALARLRTARTGPETPEPQSDAQGPDYAQECATSGSADHELSQLADDTHADEILNGPSGGRSLHQAVRAHYRAKRDEVQSAIWRGLTGPGSARQPIERVMDELDQVLGR